MINQSSSVSDIIGSAPPWSGAVVRLIMAYTPVVDGTPNYAFTFYHYSLSEYNRIVHWVIGIMEADRVVNTEAAVVSLPAGEDVAASYVDELVRDAIMSTQFSNFVERNFSVRRISPNTATGRLAGSTRLRHFSRYMLSTFSPEHRANVIITIPSCCTGR